MKFIPFLLCMMILPISTLAQGLLKDPDFEMGVPPFKEQCKSYNVYYFKIAKTGWSIKGGSPDLITPGYNSCPENHFIQPPYKIRSQCIGLAVTDFSSGSVYLNKESISTKLLSPLDTLERYFFGFNFTENLTNYGRADFSISPFVLILFSDTLNRVDTVQMDLSYSNTPDWDKVFSFFKPSQKYDQIAIELNPAFYLGDTLEKHRFYYFIDDVVLTLASEIEEIKFTPLAHTDTLRVLFDHNSSFPGVKEEMEIRSFLQSQSPLNYDSIVIVGHADTTSSYEYNYRLSLQRAEGLKKMVKENWGDSIPISIAAKSYSDFDRVGEMHLARRTDVLFYKSQGAILPWYRPADKCTEAHQLTYLSKVEEALEAAGVRKQFEVADLENTLSDQKIDARDFISRRAQDAKVLIINENHQDPFHRYFIGSLLENLKEIGYTHLAVEGLYDTENLYTTYKDPVFLDYLRKARDLEYDLYSYDVHIDTLPDVELDVKIVEGETTYAEGFEDHSVRMNKRDYYQYLGIKRILETMPKDEKLIIHVGHGHGKTQQSSKWKPMGAYLKEMLGDQVLSIDQVSLNECINPEQNDYNKHYNNQKSIVPYTTSGPYVRKEFNLLTFSKDEFYDLSVLHPIERKSDLRTTPTKEISFSIEEFDSDYPCMVLVYFREDDPLHATAFSVQEIDSSAANITVVLPRDFPSRLIVKCAAERVVVDVDFE